MIKRLLSLTLVILPLLILAQLQSFTVNLTGTPETCPNNGTLSWTTSGTTANSTLTYTIYNTANLTTPVETTSLLTFTGLPAGTYRVVATQTLSGTTQSNQATSNNFTINNQKPREMIVWAFNTNSEVCGNDGSIRIDVYEGRAPYRYQILDNNNNVSIEAETSTNTHTFEGLSAGNYKYRVIDACGTGLVGERSVGRGVSNFTKIRYRSVNSSDCLGYQLIFMDLDLKGAKFPLQISVSYTNPETGQIVTLNGTDTTMPVIPRFSGVTKLPLTIVTTDGCGRTVTQTDEFDFTSGYSVIPQPAYKAACGGRYLSFEIHPGLEYKNSVNTFKIEFIESPSGFDPTVYNSSHGQLMKSHYYGNENQPIPFGTYRYKIIDECGVELEKTMVIKAEFDFTLWNRQSCNTGLVLIEGNTIYDFNNTKITSAPQAFINQYGPLPYTIPEDRFEIVDGHRKQFVLNDIPPGQYTFSSGTDCNNLTVSRSIDAPIQNIREASPEVEFDCSGKFRFNKYTFYQRYFPEQGGWGTSPTNIDVPGEKTNYWVAYGSLWERRSPGLYRAIQTVAIPTVENNVYKNTWCDHIVLKEFEVVDVGSLTFSNAYAFECANGTYDVVLQAKGTAPLTYVIVSSEANDAAIIKNNGTNPIFEGLAGGTYFFRVYDQCGNFQTRKLDIAKLGRPGIRMAPVCPTNELSLVVDGLDYLKYEWTKEGEPNNILSTTNVLSLGEYTADKAGVYHVRLSTNSPTSCINSTLDLKLTVDALTAANAGTGQTVNLAYDEAMGTSIDLFDYLKGNYDGFGTWTETTIPSSSLLVGNQWKVSSAQSGTYSFKYTVTGACGGKADTAEVTINLAKVCYKKPIISTAGDALPTRVGISSLARLGVDAKGENWPMVREGGWIALESNAKGFVVNRVAFNSNGLPVGIPPANFVAGMMVYDTTNNCLKIYNGRIWSCFSTQTCPE
ncbi:hypothetical protein PG630_05825 [Riemerella anatipestifer]|nr:hypothetical protein [Riemerella anatipestifer]